MAELDLRPPVISSHVLDSFKGTRLGFVFTFLSLLFYCALLL